MEMINYEHSAEAVNKKSNDGLLLVHLERYVVILSSLNIANKDHFYSPEK